MNHRKVIGVILLCIVALELLGFGYILRAHRQRARLPAPTGTYQVGRVQYDWTDPTRADRLADGLTGPRRLAVWIWYPTVATTGQPAPYLPDNWRKAQSDSGDVVSRAVDGALNVFVGTSPPRTHSYRDAPMAPSPEKLPVLVMQPGMGLANPDYTAFAENLASHGYVVVGINETDSSSLVVFADGQTVRATAKGKIADDVSSADVARQAELIGPVWSADATFVLDTLQHLNDEASSRFFQRLDLNRIGLFGHSFGGATAIAVCQRDQRCVAGADLDGTPTASTREHAIPRPFLFVTEEYSGGGLADTDCRLVWESYQQTSGPAAFITIDGTAHSNFSDVPLQFTRLGRALLRQLGVIGAINPRRGLEVMNAYLVAFFDRYVKGLNAPPLDQLPAFPEAQVSSKS